MSLEAELHNVGCAGNHKLLVLSFVLYQGNPHRNSPVPSLPPVLGCQPNHRQNHKAVKSLSSRDLCVPCVCYSCHHGSLTPRPTLANMASSPIPFLKADSESIHTYVRILDNCLTLSMDQTSAEEMKLQW